MLFKFDPDLSLKLGFDVWFDNLFDLELDDEIHLPYTILLNKGLVWLFGVFLALYILCNEENNRIGGGWIQIIL